MQIAGTSKLAQFRLELVSIRLSGDAFQFIRAVRSRKAVALAVTECSSRIVLLALSDVFETTKSIDACGGFSHDPNEIGIGLYRLLDCVLQLTIIVLIWVLRDYRVQGDAIVDIGEDTLDSIVASWLFALR